MIQHEKIPISEFSLFICFEQKVMVQNFSQTQLIFHEDNYNMINVEFICFLIAWGQEFNLN